MKMKGMTTARRNKMKLFGKCLSLMLSICLILSFMTTMAVADDNEGNPSILSAKLYTSLSGGTLVCDLLDENAAIPEWPVDQEYYLKVTVASSIGAEDWVSVSILNQLYYTNTPGLEEGVINHTALSEVLSYEDADLTVNQTGIYAQKPFWNDCLRHYSDCRRESGGE